MDNHNDFDSVSWQRDADDDQKKPSQPTYAGVDTMTYRKSNGRRRRSSASSEPQAGPGADAVDLAGIGDGVLDCTVDTPLKENDGAKDSFVSYLVTTHTDFKSFDKSQFSVRRRFTDFLFLHNTLQREYPACAVPPLPEKNNMAYVRGDRFSKEFTQRRAWSLHRFITRITMHPVLRRAAIFLLFLETADWNAQMRLRPNRATVNNEVANNTSSGFFDNMADTMLNAFSKVHKPDKRFIEITERASKLDEDLNHIEKFTARAVRRQGDLEQDYADLAVNMRKLTPLEPGIEAPLHTFASCVEETSRGIGMLRDHTDQNYLGSLRDMDAYISSLKSLLKTREQKQLDFEGLTEYLQKASTDRDTLASHGGYSHGSSMNPATFIRNKVEDIRGVDHETARREKARKLDVKIEELNREVDNAKNTSEMFDEQVMREVTDFERIKGLEFRDTLATLATTHINFYQSVIETWERFLLDQDADQPVPKKKGKTSS